MTKQRYSNFLLYGILILPWVITFLVFWMYPLLHALFISFTKYDTIQSTSIWIGFENYLRAFSDQLFWKSLKTTSIFTIVTVPISTCLALVLALLVNKEQLRFANFFRATFFLPSVTSLVVIALIFTNVYSRDGYVVSLLKFFSFIKGDAGVLQSPTTALWGIIAMDIWISAGYYMVLFLAGLQSISKDLYESARLFGASSWQQLIKITLPLLKPTLLFIVVINTIKTFQVFVEIYVMTKGGPLYSTTTVVYMVYQKAFNELNQMGYASAIAFILFVIISLLTFIQLKVIKKI